MSVKIVDVHPHIIADDALRYPLAPVGGVRSGWSATRPVTFEQLIANMDEAGVDKAAIVHSSTTYGFDNAYVADCVMQLPERFTGVFAIDVLQEDAVDTFNHWLTRGMTGMRLFTGGKTGQTDGDWLVDPTTFPVWERAAEMGMTVAIQTTPTGLHMVVELLQRFPAVNIILDHLARPVLDDGPPYKNAASLFALSKYDNLFLKMTPRTCDLSQCGLAAPGSFFTQLVSEFGADHIAYGSNFPASEGSLTELVNQARQCLSHLSGEERAWILGRTAQYLYPALAD